MSTLYMMCGLPGSGKGSFAKRLAKSHKTVLISTAQISEEMFKYRKNLTDEDVFKAAIQRIRAEIEAGKSVVFDGANIKRGRREQIISSLPAGTSVEIFFMDIPYSICYENATTTKTRPVSPGTMARLRNMLEIPMPDEADKVHNCTPKRLQE